MKPFYLSLLAAMLANSGLATLQSEKPRGLPLASLAELTRATEERTTAVRIILFQNTGDLWSHPVLSYKTYRELPAGGLERFINEKTAEAIASGPFKDPTQEHGVSFDGLRTTPDGKIDLSLFYGVVYFFPGVQPLSPELAVSEPIYQVHIASAIPYLASLFVDNLDRAAIEIEDGKGRVTGWQDSAVHFYGEDTVSVNPDYGVLYFPKRLIDTPGRITLYKKGVVETYSLSGTYLPTARVPFFFSLRRLRYDALRMTVSGGTKGHYVVEVSEDMRVWRSVFPELLTLSSTGAAEHTLPIIRGENAAGFYRARHIRGTPEIRIVE